MIFGEFLIFGDSFFNTEVAGSREVFYVFFRQNDTLSRIRSVPKHSGPRAYFRGTWNLSLDGDRMELDPRRTAFSTESNLPHLRNDSVSATKRPVDSNTSPTDILNAAASGVRSRSFQLTVTFDF